MVSRTRTKKNNTNAQPKLNFNLIQESQYPHIFRNERDREGERETIQIQKLHRASVLNSPKNNNCTEQTLIYRLEPIMECKCGVIERLWSLGLRFPKMKQMREIRNPKITKSFTEWSTHKNCFSFSYLQLNFTTFLQFSRKPNKHVTKSKREQISKMRVFWFRDEESTWESVRASSNQQAERELEQSAFVKRGRLNLIHLAIAISVIKP